MRSTPLALVLCLAVAISACAAALAWINRPQDAGPGLSGPVRSASFAPFREGQSPLTKVYPSAAQIEEDLARLQGLVRGVRTYTSREGMDLVPALARKYGMTVIHSAWIEDIDGPNRAEVEALIKSANEHPDSIERVIVGNEVLLRGNLEPPQLIALIREVKGRVKQPVSYADVWAFFLKHPEVAAEVDFLTIHILPFWEDEPVSVEQAGAHIEKIYRQMAEAFPGKPILIGESGWPTGGRQRGPAAPGVVNAARFLRDLVRIAEANGFDYNLVEAYDQPWKSEREGTMGANWGMISSAREPRYPLDGPVVEDPHWPGKLALSALLAGGLVAASAGRLRRAAPGRAFVAVALAQGLALFLVSQAHAGLTLNYHWHTKAASAAGFALLAAFALALLGRAARLAAAEGGGGRVAAWLHLALVAAASVMALLIVVDGRYRDIPVLAFAVPVFGTLGLAALAGTMRWSALFGVAMGARQALGAGVALVLLALASVVAEGLAITGRDFVAMHPGFGEQWPLVVGAMGANGQVLTWAAMLVLLALPFLAEARQPRLATGQ